MPYFKNEGHGVVLGWLLVGTVLATLLFLFMPRARALTGDPDPSVRTHRVIDGDTVVLRSGVHLRLSGIDAPAIRRGVGGYQCEQERAIGLRARDRLAQLLAPGDFRVAYDRYRGKVRHDKYNRALGKIRVGKSDVGSVLVTESLARPWSGRGPRPKWCLPW